MTAAMALEPGERLQVDSGGWVALDPTGVYIAFDASAQVRGRTPSIKRAIALAEGPGREHEANPTQEKNTRTEPTLEAQRAAIEGKLNALRVDPTRS